MIRHDVFTLTVISLIAIVSFAAKNSVSQTADTTGTPPHLVEEIKKLNAIESAQKAKKSMLLSGLDSSVVELKKSAEEKGEIEKTIDETRKNLRYASEFISGKKTKGVTLDSAIYILPRINIYIPPVQNIPYPEPEPETAVKRIEKDNWFKRLFK
jgi:hypothetical protein